MRIYIALLFIFILQGKPIFATNKNLGNQEAAQKIKDFYLANYKKDGQQEWEVRGKEAFIYEDFIDINDMRAKYHTSSDVIFVSSNYARLNKKNMNLYLEGNVHIAGKEGELFSQQATLFFDNKTNKILKVVSEKNVKIIKGDDTTFAEKATYWGQEGRLILEGRPRLIYFPEENNETTGGN